MKYHYQYISPTTVRVELIPENPQEITELKRIGKIEIQHPSLDQYYKLGVSEYAKGIQLTRVRYMQFPTVALCGFEKILSAVEKIL